MPAHPPLPRTVIILLAWALLVGAIDVTLLWRGEDEPNGKPRVAPPVAAAPAESSALAPPESPPPGESTSQPVAQNKQRTAVTVAGDASPDAPDAPGSPAPASGTA